MPELTTNEENARHIIREGYVCGYEDGDHIRLVWTWNGAPLSRPEIVAEILRLIDDGEAAFTDDQVNGFYRIELAETEALVDCN